MRSFPRCIAVALLAAAAALPAPAQEVLGPERIVVPWSDPSKPGTIEVGLVNGGITVEAYSGKEVIVEARGRREGASRAGETKNGMRRIPNVSLGLTVEEERNELSIGSDSWQHAIDIRLQVPAATVLKLSCVNDGDIEVRGVSGEMELTNVNGAITVHAAAGSVVAETVNGGVKVDFVRLPAERSMAFSTLNGDVDVSLPASLKASVRMRSDNGEIFSDFDVALAERGPRVREQHSPGRFRVVIEKEVVGTINGGGPELYLKTFNGNIYIRKAK